MTLDFQKSIKNSTISRARFNKAKALYAVNLLVVKRTFYKLSVNSNAQESNGASIESHENVKCFKISKFLNKTLNIFIHFNPPTVMDTVIHKFILSFLKS